MIADHVKCQGENREDKGIESNRMKEDGWLGQALLRKQHLKKDLSAGKS